MNSNYDRKFVDVLVVTAMFPSADIPAFGIAVEREVNALRSRGISVEVVGKTRGLRGYVRQAYQLRRSSPPRLTVHAHYGTVGLVARLLFPRTPLILTLHGSEVSHGGLPALNKYWLQYWITIASCTAATKVLVQSKDMMELLPLRIRRKAIVQGQALDPAFQQARSTARSSPPTILFLSSRSRPEKNFSLASAAVSMLPKELAEMRSLDEFNPCDIPVVMRQATVGLLTSQREGLPIAIKEALVSGLPVVAVDLPSLRELTHIAGDRLTLVRSEPGAIAAALKAAIVMGRDDDAVVAITRRMDAEGWLEPGHSDVLIDLYRATARSCG